MDNKVLTDTLYCYVERENARHAKVHGKKLFGSFSAYVNALIAKDRGVEPSLGHWKAEGEVELNRVGYVKGKQGKNKRKKIRVKPTPKIQKEEVDENQLVLPGIELREPDHEVYE